MQRKKIHPPLLIILFSVSSIVLLAGCDFTANEDDDEDEAGIVLEMVAEGLTHPVMLAEPPDDTGRLFIVDQVGVIRILEEDGTLSEAPFLDIRDKIVPLNPGYDERGLLGLAFHPDFASNGRFFVYYSAPLAPDAPAGFDHTSHVSEFMVSASDPNTADPNSERILLKVNQPQSNHNAGTLAFGPDDDYLYISLGDGGNRDDEGIGHVDDWYEANAGGNGQDLTQNLLGSILRIDVDGGDPYAIPPDNPFAGEEEGLDEIYAYGFRNPYRMSFDMAGNHDLLVGDAGQELWEEVSLVTSGGNYGWNVKEGTHCFSAEEPENPPAECPDTDPEGDPLIDPVIEFANATQPDGLGVVVIGGYVYRGDDVPQLLGDYFFGVASRGEGTGGGAVYVAQPQTSGLWDFHPLEFAGANLPDGHLSDFLLSFGQDLSGEVYVLTAGNLGPSGNTGRVFRITTGTESPDGDDTGNGNGTEGEGTGGGGIYLQAD